MWGRSASRRSLSPRFRRQDFSGNSRRLTTGVDGADGGLTSSPSSGKCTRSGTPHRSPRGAISEVACAAVVASPVHLVAQWRPDVVAAGIARRPVLLRFEERAVADDVGGEVAPRGPRSQPQIPPPCPPWAAVVAVDVAVDAPPHVQRGVLVDLRTSPGSVRDRSGT